MRMTIEQFVAVVAEFDEELQSRDPSAFKAAQREGGTLALLNKHPDLSARLSARLAAWRPPEVKVKPGDWVTISGTRFRIGSVDATTGTVSIERLRADGMRVSMETGVSAEDLVADATNPREDELESMTPASARQRLTAQAVRVAMHEATRAAKAPDGVTSLSGTQLRHFWTFLHTTCAQRRAQLTQPMQSSDRSGYARWLGERHRQIAVLEALIERVHRLATASPASACDVSCVHLACGLTREQHHEVRASLQAIRDSTSYESEENYTAEYCSSALARAAQSSE